MTINKSGFAWLTVLTVLTAAATFFVAGLLVNMFERQQEGRYTFVKVVDVSEISTDPEPWGRNFPSQYESYKRTADFEHTEHGGAHSLPPSKLEKYPWLKRLYAGYAFSVDYRDARGHAFMLHDQESTRRVTEFQQAGACLHCHASIIPTYRRLGLEAAGKPATPEALAASYDEEAVMAGFRLVSQKNYEEVHAELLKTPDGVVQAKPGDPHLGDAHPVSCIDCHDPSTMQIRVTRPGFLEGIAKLARSDDPVVHLPSIQRWRDSGSEKPYNPNVDGTRQEMRTFVCAQCHVEYYCANKTTLTYPWSHGLKVENIEQTWEETKFPDGAPFYDFAHQETGAKIFKAQHPEFELWSQGIHARAGVSCADCHMAYQKQGAAKVSSHWVRSPMFDVNRSCQTCHHVPEAELKARVDTIQNRTRALTERAAAAMTDMLDAIVEAQKAGVGEADLAPVLALQRKAMWRLDFISSENSKGFHADQESARILGESIDFSRQAQAAAYKLMGSRPEGSAAEKPTPAAP